MGIWVDVIAASTSHGALCKCLNACNHGHITSQSFNCRQDR